ncbi:Hypothetical predicted protein [Mytilus galloprovincialis]|uniref:Uncharacterized protein n=1 Tax=Mytilus galloprovincialis TaxID=29158 RepID=A0A8B6E8I4_MYTGA|nr:Hypothetical predicted protein [Mytilus galloprovincialis]
MTMKLNQRLVDCAKVLQNKQLLAKLSSGDVIAQEMTYHPSCFVAVYNRDINEETNRDRKQEENIKKETSSAELVTSIFETQRNSDESVVFRLADHTNLYKDRLTKLGSPAAQIEKDKGPAIAFACDYKDTMLMAKAAEMIRCQFATKKTPFSGSLVSQDINDSTSLLCHS